MKLGSTGEHSIDEFIEGHMRISTIKITNKQNAN